MKKKLLFFENLKKIVKFLTKTNSTYNIQHFKTELIRVLQKTRSIFEINHSNKIISKVWFLSSHLNFFIFQLEKLAKFEWFWQDFFLCAGYK